MSGDTKIPDGASVGIEVEAPRQGVGQERNSIPRLLVIVAVVVALDQLTKWIIMSRLPLYETVPVINGFFNITHLENPGGAFGIFAQAGPGVRHFFFLGVTIFAMGLIYCFYRSAPTAHPSLSFALALIFGGAAGNLLDRVRLGEVVDFLDFYVKGWHWPAFNIADSAISIGITICAYHFIIKGDHWR
jgi:signal peptidase II